MSVRPVTAVLLGAGDRGAGSYAPYALANPHRLRFVAVAEPHHVRRERFAALHAIADQSSVSDWTELLARPRLADAILICTQDTMHFEPAMAALELGYQVLLEKPMSTDPAECVRLGEADQNSPGRAIICYVLRYTPFFATIKALLDHGRIGQIISIQLTENVPLVDQTHAFVRGNWRKSSETCPMILAHSCHDMDLLTWFAGSPCRSVSSFGSLSHFRPEEAPAGATERCLDGCPHESRCPHHVSKIYLTDNVDWPASVISPDLSLIARLAALQNGPYGRCVYSCDNDAVDHQVASFEFNNNVTAVFTMCGFNGRPGRTLQLMGTAGEIRASMAANEIEVLDFATGSAEVIRHAISRHRYGGGDQGIMQYFVDWVRDDRGEPGLTSAFGSIESHLMALAAERSRVTGRTIKMSDYQREVSETLNPAILS